MLKIPVPSISAKVFEPHTLPHPPNGTDTEINGELILLFEDEKEAVDYLDALEDYAAELDNHSPDKRIVNGLITAINNDDFVQTYLR